MILVDTSVWIDHLRRSEPAFVELLREAKLCSHPLVTGEVLMGNVQDRSSLRELFSLMPGVPSLSNLEVVAFVEREKVYGLGIGFVDAHLLATCISADCLLWTRDRRLGVLAESFQRRFVEP